MPEERSCFNCASWWWDPFSPEDFKCCYEGHRPYDHEDASDCKDWSPAPPKESEDA